MPELFLVHHLLERAAQRHGDRPAISCGGKTISYAALRDEAWAIGAGLQSAGVQPGDRVLLMLENSVEFAASLFGALACGAIAVPINPQTRQARLSFIQDDCEPAAFITHASLPALRGTGSVFATSGIVDQDSALIMYTSGSTGQPKGVQLSHLNVLSASRSIQAYLGLQSSDVIFCGLPLSFDYGLYQLLLAAQVGAEVLLERNMTFSGQVMKQLAEGNVSVLPGVPTSFELLLRVKAFNAAALPRLRMMTNTGAALSQRAITKLRSSFPEAQLFSMYGLTECKRVSFLPPAMLDLRPGSVGRGMPNQEIWLVDADGMRLPPGNVGELVVRGSHVMIGYWRRPDDTRSVIHIDSRTGERCLRTGDYFVMDHEGYLYFESRRDDVIKSSGQKVYPREVEAAIEGLEGVAEVAVAGVRDALQGQIVKAFVVLLPGYCYEEHAILAHCRAQLEAYMVPAVVEIRADLPHGENGKVDRRRLQESEPAMVPD